MRQAAILFGQPANLYAGKGDHQERRSAGIMDAGERIRRDVQDKAAGAKTGALLLEVAGAPIVGLTDYGDVPTRRLEPQHMIEQVVIAVIALARPVIGHRGSAEVAGIARKAGRGPPAVDPGEGGNRDFLHLVVPAWVMVDQFGDLSQNRIRTYRSSPSGWVVFLGSVVPSDTTCGAFRGFLPRAACENEERVAVMLFLFFPLSGTFIRPSDTTGVTCCDCSDISVSRSPSPFDTVSGAVRHETALSSFVSDGT